MIREIRSELIPIKFWAKDIEESAMAQVRNLANLPFAFSHIAVMPDCHTGYGMPIGGIIATKDVVIPNAVGVDIGCGMVAVKTSLKYLKKDTINIILNKIRENIPLGFKHHKKPQNGKLMPFGGKSIFSKDKDYNIVKKEYNSALNQIGTLGGGNHFIEIQSGSDGFIYLMLHSGSRNIGYKVANHYNRLAKDLASKLPYNVPRNYDLAYLMVDSREGVCYLKEMQYCLQFAKNNRNLMLEFIKQVLHDVTQCSFADEINIHHNYAALEDHFGRKVYIHRKGATRAQKEEIGIIPGSQGTKSFIVKGLGNSNSFKSCSHGAGRKMSRNQARKSLNLAQERQKIEARGIIHSIRTKRDLDEASSAYKDIQEVIELQKDLIEPLVELNPLAVVKG
jgi:tRNA-splicing ligase RtcB